MITVDQVYKNLEKGAYQSDKPYPAFDSTLPADEKLKQKQEYQKDTAEKNYQFEKDALEALGIANHPKAIKAYLLAWEHGHACGLHDVFSYLIDFADLLRE